MKLKTLLFLFICLSLSACKDDDNEPGGNGNRPETQAWIEDTMREHYFWYNEIPASEKLNYASEPEAFSNPYYPIKMEKTVEQVINTSHT